MFSRSPTLAILILAQAVSSTPSTSAGPDGGPPPPSIVERIEAPTLVPSAVPTPAPSAAPTARAAATAASPAPLPKAVPVAASAPTAPVPAAMPKASAAHGSAFGVHVSSFRKRTTAEADARRLGAQLALPARVLQVDLGAKGVWYRVVVGEVGSMAEVLALRERLKEQGIPDGVVQSLLEERRGR